ncbi:hypothetical protein GCM10010400_42580 [Streptomyces aculeolatus]|uniref:hypothetical protein n=1 Tax=Streptomyces aculeolatus TaxID=270689 RepID=UPI001CEDE5FD|nr:hypothetical protein [Streptomyces aculeolatus]
MRHGAVGHDGFVTVTDVYQYVHARLKPRHQQPLMKTDGQAGQVWLARRPLRRETTSARTDDSPAPAPAPAAAAAAAVDVRPVFTDLRGRAVRARAESHFSGVVHVFTRGSTVLSIHRDRLIEAGEGTEVTAVLSARPKHVRSTPSEDGDALFELPDGMGTVRWSASQLRESTLLFRRIRERWAFQRMRRFLLLPVLPVTRMMMTVSVDEDETPPGAGPVTAGGRAPEVHAHVRSEGDRPEFELSIPLLDYHIPRIKQGLPPF